MTFVIIRGHSLSNKLWTFNFNYNTEKKIITLHYRVYDYKLLQIDNLVRKEAADSEIEFPRAWILLK